MYLMSRWTSSDVVCSEDILNLIMNWYSWPRIKTLLDVFLIEGFLRIPSVFCSLFNNKPWWRILLSFTEVEQGWNLIYWPLCVAWVLRKPQVLWRNGARFTKNNMMSLCPSSVYLLFPGAHFSGEACYRIHYHAAPASNLIDLNKVNVNMLSSTEESFRSDWKPPIDFSESQDGSWKSANWISTGQSSCKPPFFGFHGNFAGVYLLSVALSFKWWIVQWKLTLGQKHKTDD